MRHADALCPQGHHHARDGVCRDSRKPRAADRRSSDPDRSERSDRSSLNHQHKGESFGASIPEFVTPEFVRDEVARGRAIIPEQHQSPRKRTDDHRPQFPGQDQREHRQFGDRVVDRGRGRKDALVDAVGCGHGDGPLDRQEHPRHSRMDTAKFAGADRHRSDLSGTRKGKRQGRGPDVGNLPRHADRAGRAGRRLFHDPRRRSSAVHSDDCQTHDRHRQPRRFDHGEMVPRTSRRELSLHTISRDLRDHADVRRGFQPRRRPATRVDRRRKRRGTICRARHARRTDTRSPGKWIARR